MTFRTMAELAAFAFQTGLPTPNSVTCAEDTPQVTGHFRQKR